MTPVYLGVDIGTSSSKGVLVTSSGEIVARAQRGHATANPRPGWFEHDAEAIWWRDFTALARELATATDGKTLAGIGVSGIGPCLLPADAHGIPLRPAILYGVDTRAIDQIGELEAEFGAEQIRARGGSPLTSQALGPKIAWLRQQEPEIYARTRMLLTAPSYLVNRLTGRYVLDHHSASQCTPLYDLTAQDWNHTWSEHVAPGVALPELAWPTEATGVVSAEATTETGLPAGTPVTAGTIDSWAEATSVGMNRPGDVVVMYGTTMFLIEVTDGIATHPGLWSTTGVREGSYTLAAGMATSGSITDWLATLTTGDFATLTREAAQSPPGAGGLLLLPYFAGERTPLFDPHARGGILGLTLAHTRGDLYRAILEATAFGVRHNLEVMTEAVGAAGLPRRLVAAGGGTKGDLWPRIVSDVTGRPQQIPTETVGACLGDAMLAANATGNAPEPASWNPQAGMISPDDARRELYERRYRDYLAFYRSTAEIAHRLAADQEAATDSYAKP